MSDQDTHKDLCEHIQLLDSHLQEICDATEALLMEIDRWSHPDLWKNYDRCLSAITKWRSEWCPNTPEEMERKLRNEL